MQNKWRYTQERIRSTIVKLHKQMDKSELYAVDNIKITIMLVTMTKHLSGEIIQCVCE